MLKADMDVDARYQTLRSRYGKKKAQANGYRLQGFFRREQQLLLSRIEAGSGPYIDIACGSGLMLRPLQEQADNVYGLDYNAQACIDARHNGTKIMRGDAFNMPFADNKIGQIVNCQFLNQQTADCTRRFIEEGARVLRPGGKMIILWRHADSWIHKAAHCLLSYVDKISGKPDFPQYRHPIAEIESFAHGAGLLVEYKAVTLPCLWPGTMNPSHPLANIIGASLMIVLKKP